MDIPILLGRIRPGASWGWRGAYFGADAANLSNLDWRDTEQEPPTQEELDTAWTVYLQEQADEANRVASEQASVDDVRLRWSQYAFLKGKTPQEIYDLMQGAMDDWTSLTDARADLREWLPLMAAAIAWMLMRDVHTET